MSDLRHISHALSQYGRNGDTQLVHMSSREVAALDAIGPGLTINPETGLPEAFSLEDIIAPIAGIAAGIFAPWALPWIAGAAGIGTAIGTGDIGKGLMAGLGAYGAGALGGMAAGAAGFGAEAGTIGALAGDGLASSTALAPANIAGTVGAVDTAALGALPGTATAGIGGSIAGTTGAATAAAAGAPSTAMVAAGQGAETGGGIMGFMGRNPWVAPVGLMAANAMPGAANNIPGEVKEKVQTRPLAQGPISNDARLPEGYQYGGPEKMFFDRPVSASQALDAYNMNSMQAAPQSLSQASMQGIGGLGSPQQQALQALQRQQRGYAMGGPVEEQMDPQMAQQVIGEAKAAIMGQSQNPEAAIQQFVQMFGEEALQQLVAEVQGGAAEGPVQGPGDGTSDGVQAQVGAEPVRLANDEHIMPADVVSGIGNGSSEAGHKALQAMARRVRMARSNGGAMPQSVDAQAMMPV